MLIQKTIALLLLVLLVNVFFGVDCTRMIWNPKEVNTWVYYGNNKLCAEKTIIFPNFQEGVFRIPENMDINELVLPINGILLIASNITFSEPASNCKSHENYKYKAITKESWFYTDNWKIEDADNDSSSTQGGFIHPKANNLAVPHMDRIPCECDTVIFPKSQTTSVGLQLVNELVLGNVWIDDEKQIDFDRFLLTEYGQYMFPTVASDAVRFREGICNPQTFCGCHSAQQFYAYQELLCLNEICPAEPKCLNPIKPLGHCCRICGATWLYEIDNSCNFEIEKLNAMVTRDIKRFSNGIFNNFIDFYVSIIPGQHTFSNSTIQLIVVDKNELNDKSIEFMRMLTTDQRFQGTNVKTFYSGLPYDPTQSSSTWLIIFMTLFCVIGFFGIMYVHYVEQKPLVPKWFKLPKFVNLSSPFVFARFDNAGGDGDTESIAVGVEFNTDDIQTSAGNLDGNNDSATGFNNPLFKKNVPSSAAVEILETTEMTSEMAQLQSNELSEMMTENDGGNINNVVDEKLVEIELDM